MGTASQDTDVQGLTNSRRSRKGKMCMSSLRPLGVIQGERERDSGALDGLRISFFPSSSSFKSHCTQKMFIPLSRVT